jgi:(p)ppGpp synthase/HD superfamily hydrolase
MATLEKALEIASRAHDGQVDKAGHPYILHPIRVMLNVSTPEERIAAVLHDTVEDTKITPGDLELAGFSREIIDAVQALTKEDGESRLDAARRAVANPIARQVKLADVADNMDLERIPNPTARDYKRLEEYKQVRALLLDGPAD